LRGHSFALFINRAPSPDPAVLLGDASAARDQAEPPGFGERDAPAS
jgi:hypothetical protein